MDELRTGFYYIIRKRVNPTLAFGVKNVDEVFRIRDYLGNIYTIDEVNNMDGILVLISIERVKEIQKSNNEEIDFIEDGISRLVYLK